MRQRPSRAFSASARAASARSRPNRPEAASITVASTAATPARSLSLTAICLIRSAKNSSLKSSLWC
jgi:hypothetical protein